MEYLALLLPVCLCWRPRHLFAAAAATAAAALIIAAAGSRGGTASLVYLIPVLAVTFLLSYRLGNAGGWRTIAGPVLLAATAEVTNPVFNPFLLMVTFGPWAAGEFVRSRRRLAAELAEAGRLLAAERSRYADEAVRYERVHLARDSTTRWPTG